MSRDAVGTHAGFRPDIEGFRALAVVLVLCYHAGLGFPGGYVGVDVFLVLSGFLITGVLLREASSGRIDLSEFWARRARRLLAASSLVVLATLAAGWVLLEPQRLRSLPGDVLAAASFSSNFRFAAAGDYLTGVSLPSPLLHFWSLALEEQFYVIWPLLMVFALRFRRFLRVAGTLVLVLGAASLLLSMTVTAASPAFAYFLLPTRAWELFAGAGVAVWFARGVPRWPQWLRSVAGLAGVGLVVVSAVSFGSSTVFPGSLALVPVSGAVLLLIAGASGGHPVGAVFAARPLRWVGARSYALYLWHWPVLVLAEARFGVLSAFESVAALAAAVLLADVTFRLVENPVRFSVRLAPARRSLLLGACCSLVLALTGAATITAVPERGLSALAVAPSANASSSDVLPMGSSTAESPTTSLDGSASPAASSVPSAPSSSPTDPVSPAPLPLDAGSVLGRVLLIGDSTLAPLRWFENGTLGLQGFPYLLDAESCRRLSLGSCKGREGRRPESVVPVLDALTSSGDRFDTVVVMGGYHSSPGEFRGEFLDLVEAVRRHGARMVLLDFRESLEFPEAGSGGERSMYSTFNEILRSELATGAFPDVTLLEWHAYTAARPEWFRSDGIHVNLAGTLALGEFISGSLATLAGAPCAGSANSVCELPRFAEPVDMLARYGVADTDLHCYEQGRNRARECRTDKLA